MRKRKTHQPVVVTMPSALSAAREPSRPPNPGPGEATAPAPLVLQMEVATGTHPHPGAALSPPSPIPSCWGWGGLPADDDGPFVKDGDGGHLAGGGSPALPGACHSDLAGIR